MGAVFMKKIYMAFVLILLFICIPLGGFAAPDTIASDAVGNSYDLIVVTNPPNQKDSTFNANYIISGYGKEGTAVTLYWHDATANLYRKIYNETQYVDANGARQSAYTEATVTIGASGQFMNTVNLAQGGNNILVRAENGGQTQLLRLSVTKYNYNLFDIIKSLTK